MSQRVQIISYLRLSVNSQDENSEVPAVGNSLNGMFLIFQGMNKGIRMLTFRSVGSWNVKMNCWGNLTLAFL